MKNKILIIDGNNLLYRAYYKFSNLRTSKKVLSGIVYGFPYILNGMIKQQSPDDIIVVFDGGRDAKRMEVCPEYKQRDKKLSFDSENFYEQKEAVVKLLTCLGVKIVQIPKREADDVIWLLTKRLKRKNQVVILSSDKDFNQLISESVSIYNPKAGKRITHKNCFGETGYEPHQCVDWLIMDGDASDNIKGLTGVGPAKIKDFFTKFDSIKEYLISSKEEVKSFPRHMLEPVFLRNRVLIDIRLFTQRYFDKSELFIRVPKQKINKAEFNMICSQYEISSFDEKFVKNFKKLLKNDIKVEKQLKITIKKAKIK